MILLEQVSLEVINTHLLKLGRKNHGDNIKRLSRFDHHCSMSLNEDDFLGLVFLQSDEVVKIAPRGDDRRLRAVAIRAISLGQPKLSDNWDLSPNLDLMREKLGNGSNFQKPLTICESTDGEEVYGPWYLQDGSHRALAYATLILLNEARYEHQKAFCSMSERKSRKLLFG